MLPKLVLANKFSFWSISHKVLQSAQKLDLQRGHVSLSRFLFMTGQVFTFTEFYFAPIVLNNKALKGRFRAQKLSEMYLLFIQNISPLLISLSLPYNCSWPASYD